MYSRRNGVWAQAAPWWRRVVALVVSFAHLPCLAQLPIIPGGMGYGMETVAGSGRHLDPPWTQLIRVTNLNADGPGSLRAACETQGPRTVVFEVSGVITLTRNLNIFDPYITVAGQTAPGPGIAIRGVTVNLGTHDILFQHIRVWVGDDPDGPDGGSRDGIRIWQKRGKTSNVYNVVVDHCTVVWGVDENIDVYSDDEGIYDFTISHCLIAEGLNNSIHTRSTNHSCGMLLTDLTDRGLIYGNLFAHNRLRNPTPGCGNRIIIANNLIYNPGSQTVHGGYDCAANQLTIVGNYVKQGPSSLSSTHDILRIHDYAPADAQYYVEDNHCVHADPHDPWAAVNNGVGLSVVASAPPIWRSDWVLRPSLQVYNWVLANAGAHPANRDETERRLIDSVIHGTGHVIDAVAEVGGWPTLERRYRELHMPDSPTGDGDRDGYTNLEEYLHGFAEQVGGSSP